MIVRVYNKASNSYFISEVYARINSGYYEKFLVLEKVDDNRYFRLVDYLDKSKGNSIFPVNINEISSNALPEPWVSRTEAELDGFRGILNAKDKDKSFYSYWGYAFILEHKDLLVSLLKGKKVLYEELRGDKKEICSKLDNWNYIESEEDIQNLMNIFGGFHDSVIRSLIYISGAGKDEKGMKNSDNNRQVSMIFDSDWADSIEIVFEGVLTLHLQPARDNYSSELFSATFMIKDKAILFYDDKVTEEQENYDGTWVNSLGMRWRFLNI